MTQEELARQLQEAWVSRVPISPPSEEGLRSAEAAYGVQTAWAELRAAAGERTLGRKIGLTSPGMQAQMGVTEPDFGALWASRFFPAVDGVARVAHDTFLQPRVEGELAFRLRDGLTGPGVTEADVLRASDAVAPALEIVDSRISDWRIQLADTVADNASYGGFVLGAWSAELLQEDLRAISLRVVHNGETVVDEVGAAVLGSPATAVAWLANKLGSFGVRLLAGDVILSGSFGPAVAAVPGDAFDVVVPGASGVRLEIT